MMQVDRFRQIREVCNILSDNRDTGVQRQAYLDEWLRGREFRVSSNLWGSDIHLYSFLRKKRFRV